MKQRKIPVAAPMLIANEREYVLECLDSTHISSVGRFIADFEKAFADFCGAKHAVACCNGTVALHLALVALGVGPGDEVLVPTLTFIASANSVTYCGATPVFVDCQPGTWNIDPEDAARKITPRTKGIMPVHLYGLPADLDAVQALARKHKLFVLEDAAEAHGAEFRGQRVGALGEAGTFSFYGNKIFTTGEGGMVVTNDAKLAELLRQLRGQGLDPQRRYWFPILGFNYRMTNIAAAIGLAQMEKADWHLQRRQDVASWYRAALSEAKDIELQEVPRFAHHSYWMFTILLRDSFPLERDELMKALDERGVETRPVFYPLHTLPPYRERAAACPIAEGIARRGINLPTWGGLTREDVEYVVETVQDIARRKKTKAA